MCRKHCSFIFRLIKLYLPKLVSKKNQKKNINLNNTVTFHCKIHSNYFLKEALSSLNILMFLSQFSNRYSKLRLNKDKTKEILISSH